MDIGILKAFKQILSLGAETGAAKRLFITKRDLKYQPSTEHEKSVLGCVESFLCLVVIKCLCEQEIPAYATVNDLKNTQNWNLQIFRNAKCDRIG